MKHIFIGLTICIVFAFNVFQLSAQVEVPETEELKTDTVRKKVEVAFRSIDEKDLLGGVSFIDVEEMSKKAYSTFSYAFVENVVGGMNRYIWGMDDLLVVVDGMVRDADNVLPSEIDQITILKGVSAVALYGSRAAKGVVMITTKRGKIGEPSITISANTGIRVPKAFPKYLGAAEYMTLYNEARANDGSGPQYSNEDIYYTSLGDNPYRYPDLNMYSSDYLRSMYNRSEAVVEITGGNEKVRYYTSTGYLREGSLLKVGNTADDNDNRLFARGNLDMQLHKNIAVRTDANVTFYNYSFANTGWWSNAATFRPNRVAPLIPLSYLDENDANSWDAVNASGHIIDGKYFLGGTQLHPTNPIADAYASGTSKSVSRQFQFNTGFDFNLRSLVEGLHFRSKYGIDYASAYQQAYINEYASYAPVWNNYNGSDAIDALNIYGVDRQTDVELIVYSNYQYTYNANGQFDFTRTYGDKHNVFAMAAANIWQRKFDGEYHSLSNANLGIQTSYNYMQKYYFDFSAALPYSAKLPSANRLGFSPTVTLGWRPVKEAFFGNSAFDDLMLTVSGGIISHDMDIATEDNPMGYYLYKQVLQRAGWYSWADLGGEAATEFQRGDNPDMTFIKRKELNVGLRGSLWNRALTFDFNYFMGKMDGDLALPFSQYPIYFTQTGYPTSSILPYLNYDIDDRTGFDFSVYLNKKVGEVDLTLGASGMYSNTEAERRDENISFDYQTRVGRSVDGLWGLESLGFFNSQEEISEAPAQIFGGSVRPGDLRYKDQNGDGVIDNQDQVYLGRWDTPTRLGLNFTAKFRNFTLYAMADAYFGGNGLKSSSYYWVSGDSKYSEVVRGRWTEATKDVATYPRLTTESGTNNFRSSDFWMYKTDQINLSQVQITYDIPETVFDGSFVNGLSVYLSGYNLLTISEEREHFERNVGGSPQTRLFNIGVKGTF